MPIGKKVGFTTQGYMLKPIHAPANYDPNNTTIVTQGQGQNGNGQGQGQGQQSQGNGQGYSAKK